MGMTISDYQPEVLMMSQNAPLILRSKQPVSPNRLDQKNNKAGLNMNKAIADQKQLEHEQILLKARIVKLAKEESLAKRRINESLRQQ